MPKMLLMIVPMAVAAVWLVTMARFLTRFARTETAVWESLGRPVMRLLGRNIPEEAGGDTPYRASVGPGGLQAQIYYTPDQVRATFRLAVWIAKGSYRSLADEGCRRLGTTLRVLLLVFPLAVATTMTAILS